MKILEFALSITGSLGFLIGIVTGHVIGYHQCKHNIKKGIECIDREYNCQCNKCKEEYR